LGRREHGVHSRVGDDEAGAVAGVAGDDAYEGYHQKQGRYARVEAGHRYNELLRTPGQWIPSAPSIGRFGSRTKVTDIAMKRRASLPGWHTPGAEMDGRGARCPNGRFPSDDSSRGLQVLFHAPGTGRITLPLGLGGGDRAQLCFFVDIVASS